MHLTETSNTICVLDVVKVHSHCVACMFGCPCLSLLLLLLLLRSCILLFLCLGLLAVHLAVAVVSTIAAWLLFKNGKPLLLQDHIACLFDAVGMIFMFWFALNDVDSYPFSGGGFVNVFRILRLPVSSGSFFPPRILFPPLSSPTPLAFLILRQPSLQLLQAWTTRAMLLWS